MSQLDEARALLARQQERERECAERAEERDELPCRPVLDMPPALLAALCDELAALRQRVASLDSPWHRRAREVISAAALHLVGQRVQQARELAALRDEVAAWRAFDAARTAFDRAKLAARDRADGSLDDAAAAAFDRMTEARSALMDVRDGAI